MEEIVIKIDQLKNALLGIRSDMLRCRDAEIAVSNQISVLEQVLREQGEQGLKPKQETTGE